MHSGAVRRNQVTQQSLNSLPLTKQLSATASLSPKVLPSTYSSSHAMTTDGLNDCDTAACIDYQCPFLPFNLPISHKVIFSTPHT